MSDEEAQEFDLREIQEIKSKTDAPCITSLTKTYYQYNSLSEPVEVSVGTQLVLPPREEEEEVYARTVRFHKQRTQPLDLGWLENDKVSLVLIRAAKENTENVRVEVKVKGEWGPLTLLPPGTVVGLYRTTYDDLRISGVKVDRAHTTVFPG